MSTSGNDQTSTSSQPNKVRFETIETDIRDVRTEMTRLSTTVELMLAKLEIIHPARGVDLGVEEEVIQGDRRTHGERPPQANPLYESDDRDDQRDRSPAHYRHGGRVERGDRVAERWIEPNRRRQRPGVGRGPERDGSSSEDEIRRDNRRNYRGNPNQERPRNRQFEDNDYEVGRRGNQGPRKPKIDFPHFSGGDPYEWLDKANRYFRVYEISRTDKVDIASMYLDGQANSWWRWLKDQYEHDRQRLGWTAFEQEFVDQWGPSPVTDHHGQLAKLRQEGKVQNYINEFRRLQTMTRDWTETHLIGMFTEGLKPGLAKEVKLKKPTTLREAMRTAEILEEGPGERRSFKENTGSKFSKSLQPGNSWKGNAEEGSSAKTKSNEIRRLSREEVQDCIKKGICFNCKEKWVKGHQCRNNKLLMVIGSDESELETEKEDETSSDEGELRVAESSEEKEMAELSLNAISGTPRPSTMRLMAWIGSSEVSLLVDSGSSHNFINMNTVKKLGMKGTAIEAFDVRVANGERLK